MSDIRELYFQKMILQEGSMVTPELQIIDRRTNHVVCSDAHGNMQSFMISEAYEMQRKLPSSVKLVDVVKDFPKDIIPEAVLDLLEQPTTGSIDKYNTLTILRGIQALALSEGTCGIFDDVQRRLQKIDSKFSLSEHFSRPENQTSVVIKAPTLNFEEKQNLSEKKSLRSFMVESVDEFKRKLNTMTPSDVDDLADKIDSFDDIADHYDEDEIVNKVEEHLSRESRIKKSIDFRKSEAKRERGREIALHRLSSPQKIISKSRKAAIALIKEKLAHKSLDKLTVEEKNRLEDMINKRRDLVDRLARKLAPKIKALEKDRVYHHKVSEEFVKTHSHAMLMESPAIVHDIDKQPFNDRMSKILDAVDHKSTLVNGIMFKSEVTPSGHVIMYHKDEHGNKSSASIFRLAKDGVAVHQTVSKMNSDSPEGIYANIQHMVDSGLEVRSDKEQSLGGRNLWKNIHNHVKYGSAGVLSDNGKVEKVADFNDQESSNKSTVFFIKK